MTPDALREALITYPVNKKPKHWSSDRWNGWLQGRMTANRTGCCCCGFGDDDETILKYCLVHKAALDAARREMRERCAEVLKDGGGLYVNSLQMIEAILALPDEPGDT